MVRPDPIVPRCFIASRARATSAVGGLAIPAAILLLFPAVTHADVVTGGATTTVADAAAIASPLSFVQGDGTAGTLVVLGGGTYTGSWSMDNAIGVFDLSGGSFTIAPGLGETATATGTCSIGVTNGTLTLGAESFLTGFTGSLDVQATGSLVLVDDRWLTNSTSIQLAGDFVGTGLASLVYAGTADVTYAGALVLSGGNTSAINTSGAGAGDLTLSGAVSGSGNLLIGAEAGSTATVTLALTGGFTGRTTIFGTDALIRTQASIGSQGLTISGANVSSDTNLLIGSAQTLVVNGISTFTGAGALASTLTVNGEMQGAGSLTFSNTALVVGGTTSTFTGNVTLRGGSTISTGNAAWVGSLGALTMNADGQVTSFAYTGGSNATYGGILTLGEGNNGITLNGASGSLTLNGAVGQALGTVGNLVITSNGGSTGTVHLAFAGGTFDGRTVIDGAKVSLDTASAIGALGLDLDDGADVTLGTNLTIGATQQLRLAGNSSITAGAGTSLIVDGDMQGAGTLQLSNVDLTVGAAATNAFTGGLVLRDTSTATTGNDTWLGAITALTFGGDGTATTFEYTGAVDLASSATVSVGTGTATVKASGAGNLTLNGAVSGAGTLVLDGVDLSVGAAAGATFTGGFQLRSGAAATVASGAWIGGVTAIGLNADGAATSFEYSGAGNASTAAAVTVGAGTATVTLTGAGNLAFTGAVAGTGDLKVTDGGVGTGDFTLAFSSGSFSGRTIIDAIDGTISTAASVGTAGLTIGGASEVTLGANVALAGTADLLVDGTATLTGSTATRTFTAAGGLNGTGAGAALTLDSVKLTVGDGAASTFDGSITLTDGASLILDGADLSNAAVSGNAGAAAGSLTIGGVGTLASIGVAQDFNGILSVGDRGDSASSVLNVTGAVNLAAGATLRSYLIDDTGVADRLNATGAVQAGGSTAKIVYDEDFFTGDLIPAAGATTTYQVVSAAGGLNGTFGTVSFVTVDPLTGLETSRTIDQTDGTRFLGGLFEVEYGANDFSLSITGFPGPDPLPPGTTSTNVAVDVQVGPNTVRRNANIGVVQNSQINASVVAMNALITDPASSADVQYVGTQLLLNPAGPYASAVVAVSSLANPYAMPTATMDQLFQAGDVAMKRLMQLRSGLMASAAKDGAPASSGQAGAQQPQQALRASRPFGAELNGATPDIGSRVWTRGFGYSGNVSNDTWAQSQYSVVAGGALLGADAYLGNGAILGGFVGYAPGSVDITTGLVDESNNLNGVDFGFYGSWVPGKGRWYVEGSAVGQFGMVDRTRTLYVPGVVRVANSSNNQWGLAAGGETGLNLWLGGDTYLQPYARAFFGLFNREGYTESGAGSANLTVGNQQAYAIQPTVGTRFMHGMRMSGSVLTPYVGGGFTASVPLGDWSTDATNSFSGLPGFTVFNDPETRYGGSLEAGLEWAFPSGLTAYASFNGMFMTDAQQYGGQIGLNIPF